MLDIGPPSSTTRSDPQALLLAEHGRCRAACKAASSLTDHDEADLPWIEATAAHLVGYFDGDLLSHERDEEDVVARALVAHDRRLAATIGLLVTQHAMLRDAIADATGTWTALEACPSMLAEVRADLAARTRRLVAMIESHLELEEQLLLPRLAELPEEARRAMCAKLHVPRG